MTNHRLTITAAIAVIAAALSLYSVLQGDGWMAASIGAVIVVATAGTLTRLATIPAAIAATAAVLLAFAVPLGSKGWLGLAGALVVVGLAALSATGSRLPRAFAALATYAGLLVLYLDVVFAHSKALGGIIPTRTSLAALSHMPAQASTLFAYSPPVQPNRAVEFVAAAGIGAVAILVDLVAVRLRRPAIAGLPLLLLFSVPVASSLKGFGLYQTLTFGVGISAYLALLSTDGRQRLRMWGRLVTIRHVSPVDENNTAPDTREMAASGRRVGLAAVAVAMAVPVVLVGSSPRDIFKHSVGDGGLTGIGIASGTESPLLTISGELSESHPKQVLTYTTTAQDPTQQYFQEYVLTYYAHSNQWLQVRGSYTPVSSPALKDPAPGLDAATPAAKVTTHIDVSGLIDGSPLPLPYAPTKISDDEHLALAEEPGTLMVVTDQALGNLSYTVDSTEPDESTTAMSNDVAPPNAITRAYGAYNGPDEAKLTSIAYAHIGTGSTPLQQADELQAWFQSGAFAYTTKPNLPDTSHWLLDFLTKDKRGDCEQFAPAFAVLARLIGIPSRVVVGYTAGSVTGDQGVVTTADAHAWPELYIATVGWVRFEPTPNGAQDQGTATLPDYTTGKIPGLPGLGSQSPTSPSTGTSTKPSPGLGGRKPRNLGGSGGSTTAAAGSGSGFPVGIAIAIAVFLLLAWPAGGRWLTSRRRWLTASTDAGQAQAAWLELSDYLSDYGLEGPVSESPRAAAARVAAEVGSPAAAAAAVRIGAAEERARYSVAPTPGAGLSADVATTRKAIAATCTWSRRIRARLLPASTLGKVLGGVQSANRALSWIDSPLPNLRHRAARRATSRA
jgi:transglutaminase-like putative cysteine protease